ncbi:YnbE family lipoprotein [Algimonas porphyrae]|uniref:YnbE family lipoprotein n=1 Tax=Algimonas porphyrae TaxID=1128113 RepID=A0ABQ5V4X2_9PROT|nr:YnbE family lipoprotein [Algimonas porphyrae]GLQ21999.1 YnbE family lipoprotein [Algimonas porphyrae]
MMRAKTRLTFALLTMASTVFVAGCTVTHKVEAPKEPIRVELAIKIDQEVRVRLDDDVEELINENPDLF